MKKLLFISLLIFVVGFPLAYGHPFLVETDPPQSSNIPAGVTQIVTHYSEAVEVDYSIVKVFDASGNQIDNKDVRYFEGEVSLIVTTPPLEDGVYTVTTKVLSKIDGHLVDYAFVFAVGNVRIDPELIEQQGSPETLFFPEAGARFPGFVGETIVLGSVISSLLIIGIQKKGFIKEQFEKIEQVYQNKFSLLIGVGLIAVFASNVLLLAMQTIRLETSAFDALQTSFGTSWLIRMGITISLIIVWFLMQRKQNLSKKSQIPLLALSLALIGTSTMIGHGAASEQVPAMILDYIHNLLASIWIGGIIFFVAALLPTFSNLENKKKELLSLVVLPRFSIMIVVALGILIISGPTLLWFLESNVGLLTESTYGRLIIAKIVLASIMVVFGGYKQFRVQKNAEKNIKTGSINIYKKLKRSLKVESGLGIALLGVVALLANGTLPAGEIQQVQAQIVTYDFQTLEFSQGAKFDINISPFTSGQNTITVLVKDFEGDSLQDIAGLNVKVSNPQRNIAPIEIPINEVQLADGTISYEGEITFGFSGNWQIEVEALRTQSANDGVTLDLLVKPRLTDLKTEIIEYEFPQQTAALYPVFDGRDSIWISDPSGPRLWKFSIESEQFDSFEFKGKTAITLTIDNDGKIWFIDIPESSIGFIEPQTEEITVISLPRDSIAISLQADSENNIWVSLNIDNMLLKYDQKTGKFEEYTIPTPEGGPFALLRDSTGKIWFTETSSGKIGFIEPITAKIKEFTSDDPLESPEAIIFDKDGNLWITEHTGLALVKFNPVLETFERILVPDPDALPFGMTFDRYNNIWFAQHTIDKLGVYDPHNENLVEIEVPTSPSFVQFMTSDDKNNVWFVEQRGNKLGMVKITEMPSVSVAQQQVQKIDLKYTELVSPLISAGIIATSLFFVKSLKDKRRIDSEISQQ